MNRDNISYSSDDTGKKENVNGAEGKIGRNAKTFECRIYMVCVCVCVWIVIFMCTQMEENIENDLSSYIHSNG